MRLKRAVLLCVLVLIFGCGRTTGPGNRAPYKPHDPEPLDGSINQPVNTNVLWKGGDPDGDPVTYDIYFGEDLSPSLALSGVYIPEYDPGTLDTFTVYYWKVVSKDANGTEAEGNIWNFTTGNNPPFIPGNPDPQDSAVDQSIFCRLSWSGGDPDGDTLTYYLYFSTSSPPLLAATLDSNGYDPGALVFGTTYYWKVTARDRHNNVAESAIWSFTTMDTLPVPQNVVIVADTEGDGVEISWDQASNVDGYEVTTPGGDSIVLNYDETSYADDAPSETGTYTVCTFLGSVKGSNAIVSSKPYVSGFNVVLYVWSDPVQPAGFGWDPAIGSGSVYDCIDENKDSVDFYLNDSTAVFDFTSADQSPYMGNKTTGILLMGPTNFFEAPATGYISSISAQALYYYAMKVEGDYYAKLQVLSVVPGVSASFTFEFQKVQGLRIF